MPIRFPGEVSTIDDLREAVLTLVESIEEPQPAPVEVVTVADEEAPEMDSTPVEPTLSRSAEPEPEPIAKEPEASSETVTSNEDASSQHSSADARKQPKSPEEEAKLAAKYAAIEDVGERAFTILKDLGMV